MYLRNVGGFHHISTAVGLAYCLSNAAPEWQARIFGRRSIELMVACPLEGLVRKGRDTFIQKLSVRMSNTSIIGCCDHLSILKQN